MADERPPWARRLANERRARGWSYSDVVKAMYAHATPEEAKQLPGFESLKRNYRRWETEGVEPDKGRSELLFKPIIAVPSAPLRTPYSRSSRVRTSPRSWR